MRLQGQWLDSPLAATTGPDLARQLWVAVSAGCWASTKATRLELQLEQRSGDSLVCSSWQRLDEPKLEEQ